LSIPKTKKQLETSYRAKYLDYQQRIVNLEKEAKRLELIAKGD